MGCVRKQKSRKSFKNYDQNVCSKSFIVWLLIMIKFLKRQCIKLETLCASLLSSYAALNIGLFDINVFDSFYLSISEVVDDYSIFAIMKYINATGRLNPITEWRD